MEKLVHVVREREDRDGADLRTEVLGTVVPALVDAGASGVTVHVADDRVGIPGPMPCPGGELPVRAAISYWVPAHDLARDAVDAAAAVGIRNDAYLVTESLWSEFGQRRGEPRDWPDGERSPGLVTVALVHRNPQLDPRTFRELWYGHQSPMSERVQPRLRYVRNTVVHPVTPGAPPLDGVVVESWPSEEVVSDIEAFHLGDLGNLTVMLDSVQTAFDMPRLRSLAMSEHLWS
ncbi:hypothetical protein [Dermatobacter hominis]|uniref:hypothetical protein n=1 Tax=Dermatobacter hominis TaxID=2884263 RepID=UPI001D110BD3|nr:hypothetical protein [Dermatobacter hominis]UDY35392.1 hypothetical protein LH044_18935 [Dermatobacter hominis]